MASAVSREAYLETGIEVLADLGYGGLKLAEVCERLSVTTGSFYHYFTSWASYTRELLDHWQQASTTRVVDWVRNEPDPRKRIDRIIHLGLSLPYSAEAAIRVWSGIDPQVRRVQAEVDRQRHDIVRESALEILHDDRQAKLFADWAVYVLIGYEQCTLPPDHNGLEWIVSQMLDALHTGRFSTTSRSR